MAQVFAAGVLLLWHLFVKDYKVSQWAYIDDLLPKLGKEKKN